MNLLEALEKGAAVLRVLGPLADQVNNYLHHNGPEPALFEKLPELKSPAALERARIAARRSSSTPPAQ